MILFSSGIGSALCVAQKPGFDDNRSRGFRTNFFVGGADDVVRRIAVRGGAEVVEEIGLLQQSP